MLGTLTAIAQNNDRDCIRMGNKYFRDKDFSQAETYYRKALDKNPSLEALYDLGLALTFQNKDSLAYDNFTKSLEQMAPTQEKKAWVYHNMGNLTFLNGRSQMKANSPDALKSFQQSVELYKSSLRCNPSDNETRYNLAMAQYLVKKLQQQQNQNQQNQNQNQNQQNQDQNKQDQNKDQQNKDQNKQDQDKDKQNQDQNKQDQNKDKQNQDKQNQDQNKQNQDKQNQQKQQGQPEDQRGQMSDRAAEQLLNSAQQDEKGVQRKVQKAEKAHRRGLEKDW